MATFRIWFGNASCDVPAAPTAGTHVAGITQIQWVWNASVDATGYWWNTTNNLGTATDLGNVLTYTETGLPEDTAQNSYVWAYNDCGVSTVTVLTSTTLNAELWATCDNSSTSWEVIVKLLLINCVECGDDNSIMSYIKSALVTDGTSLYLKTNVDCGIRAGESGLDQLGIRVLYGDEDTEYAACDQADSLEFILKRLITIGDDGLYYLNVV